MFGQFRVIKKVFAKNIFKKNILKKISTKNLAKQHFFEKKILGDFLVNFKKQTELINLRNNVLYLKNNYQSYILFMVILK